MSMRINPAEIEQQIANLLLHYPELADDEQFRTDMIDAETGALEFLSMLVKSIGENATLVEANKLYRDELKGRADRIERRIEALRVLAFGIMQRADLRKVELPEATLSIRAGTPKVIITDENVLPDLLCKFARSPDKAKIKDMLAQGLEVRGAVMSNSEPSLAIRTK